MKEKKKRVYEWMNEWMNEWMYEWVKEWINTLITKNVDYQRNASIPLNLKSVQKSVLWHDEKYVGNSYFSRFL